MSDYVEFGVIDVNVKALFNLEKYSDKRIVLNIIKEESRLDVIDNLDKEKDIYGRSLTPKKKNDGKKILHDSGDFAKDMENPNNYITGTNDLVIKTTVYSTGKKKTSPFFYGYKHNWGENITQRQVVGWSPKLHDKVQLRLASLFNV